MYKYLLLSVVTAFFVAAGISTLVLAQVESTQAKGNAGTLVDINKLRSQRAVNNNQNSSFIGKDYFPLVRNSRQVYQVKGTGYRYYNNQQRDSETIDRVETGLIGSPVYKYGHMLYQLSYLNRQGEVEEIEVENNEITALAYMDNQVIGISEDDPRKPAILLPASFKVGSKWIVNPQGYHSCAGRISLSCDKQFQTFTNKLGHKYSDVILISGKCTFHDCGESEIYKISCHAYLAKGIGIIEADLDYSYNYSFNRLSGAKNGWSSKAYYTVSRKDK